MVVRHVTHGGEEKCGRILLGSLKERDHLEDQRKNSMIV
jgi:hypothetical protein